MSTIIGTGSESSRAAGRSTARPREGGDAAAGQRRVGVRPDGDDGAADVVTGDEPEIGCWQ
jgi:hypothetical protein